MHRCTAGTHVARARARSAESDTRDATTPVCLRQGDLTQMRGRTSAMGAGAAPASHLTPRPAQQTTPSMHRSSQHCDRVASAARDAHRSCCRYCRCHCCCRSCGRCCYCCCCAVAAAAAAAAAHARAEHTAQYTRSHAHTHARIGTCTHAHARAQGQCRPQIWRL